MKKKFFILLLLISFPFIVTAGGITLKDGTQVECQGVWEEGNEIKCFQNGRITSYPNNQVSSGGDVSPKVERPQTNQNNNVVKEEYEEPKKAKPGTIPEKQKRLIKIVNRYYPKYEVAPNELKKSALRRRRKDEISSIMDDLRAENWIGILKEMGTNSEGKANITIQLPNSKATIKTWNNALSDIGSNTLIEPNTNLYEAISNLSKGDKVVFTGTFFNDEQDYIEEISLTELGSMRSPEFLLRFSNIYKLKLYK